MTHLIAHALQPFETDRSRHPPLTLDLEAGCLLCIVGPNGGGKTDYLRTLGGVDPPASGSLHLLQHDISSLDTPAWRQLRKRAAFITDGAPLLSVIDALSNVMMPALYHRTAVPAAVQQQAEALLQKVGYDGDLHALPAYLNEHQRRLLALARSLILEPEILFVDEPFHMADDACRRHHGEVYVRLARDMGIAVVIATHNLGFVRRRADRILFVCPGQVALHETWQSFAASQDPDIRAFLDAADT